MPKINNTLKERKQKLFERLTPEYLFSKTSVFSNMPSGFPQLDEKTLDHIKKQYKIYFNSWIEDEAKKFLL